jgi:hypothetical protein
LINKDSPGAIRVSISPGRRFSAASVLRLTGPALDAREGVTLGGAVVDETGRWTPKLRESADQRDGEVIINVPAASAALVALHA